MGPLLSEKEWVRCMEIAYEEVNNACVLLGGVITTSTRRAIEKIKILESIGYNKIAVTPTFYITLKSDDEIISHFGNCRQSTSMDIIGYNIPSCTGSSISPDAMEYMCKNNWISAIKESSGSKEYFEEILRIAKDNGINVLQGSEVDIAWALSLGASGIVPVCANYDPATYIAICDAAQKNDKKRMLELQDRIMQIRELALRQGDNWIAGIMYAVSSLGIGNGFPVLPIQPLSAQEMAKVDKLHEFEVVNNSVF